MTKPIEQITAAELKEARARLAKAERRAASLPTPVRWLLIAFIVLFVMGPITSALCWIMWRVR